MTAKRRPELVGSVSGELELALPGELDRRPDASPDDHRAEEHEQQQHHPGHGLGHDQRRAGLRDRIDVVADDQARRPLDIADGRMHDHGAVVRPGDTDVDPPNLGGHRIGHVHIRLGKCRAIFDAGDLRDRQAAERQAERSSRSGWAGRGPPSNLADT